MDIEVGSLGVTGLILDVLPEDLPPTILSDSLNLTYNGRHTEPMIQEVSRAPALPNGESPLLIESLYVAGDLLCWLALTETKAYLYYMFDWYDVTPANMNKASYWQGTHINGYFLVNSGRQKPLYVDLYDPLTPLKTYEVWPADLICEVVTSLDGFLIGCSPQDSTGYFNKQLVLWSDASDPGSLPSNFNFTDPASRAGFTTLDGYEGAVVAVPLENRIQLYRSYSIYDIAFVGGSAVFSFTRRQLQPNLLSRTGVAAYRRSHFCVGDGYFYLYNGFDLQPLGEDAVCATFFETLNRDYQSLISVMFDSRLNEIVIAYPEGTATRCNRALIFDLAKQVWKKRALPDVTAMASGFVPRAVDLVAWDQLTVTWDAWDKPWGLVYVQPETSNYVMGNSAGLFKIPDEGLYMQAYGQRLFLSFDNKDVAGNPVVSRHVRKMVTEFWAECNGVLRIRLGGSDSKGAPISWGTWMTWNSALDMHKSYIVSGKFLSIEFDNNVGEVPTAFTYGGYNLKLSTAGRY